MSRREVAAGCSCSHLLLSSLALDNLVTGHGQQKPLSAGEVIPRCARAVGLGTVTRNAGNWRGLATMSQQSWVESLVGLQWHPHMLD